MSPYRIWQRLLPRSAPRVRRAARRRSTGGRCVRPVLERLEDRTLPSRGTLTASVYAINGNTQFGAAQAAPGQTVTFRVTYTLPTSTVVNYQLTDFLPLPAFPAGSFTFNPVVSAVPPAVGQAQFGPSDTFFGISGITPAVTTNAADNSVHFNFGSFTDAQGRPSTTDLLFTVQTSDAPAIDRQFVTNLARESEGASSGGSTPLDATTQIELLEPRDIMTKGVVSTNDPVATIFAPPTAGPVPFTLPGQSGPAFTGTITYTGLQADPVHSRLRGVKAGDLVKFAIIVENVGTAPNGSFNVTVKDTFPAGFQIPTDAAGLNLQVVDGTGAAFSVIDLGGGLFGNGIQLADHGATGALAPGLNPDGTIINNGRNVAVVTYDLQVAPTVIPGQMLINVGTLSRYTSSPTGPNFNGYSNDSHVTVSLADEAVTKTVDNPAPLFGTSVTYTVTVTNTGPDTATGVVVADPLPPALVLVSETPSQGSYDGHVWTVGTLAPGASAVLHFTAQTAALGTIVNTAIVKADQLDRTPADNIATAVITVLRNPSQVSKFFFFGSTMSDDPPADPPVDPATFPGNAQFVTQTYRDLLHRDPTALELASGSDLLDNGGSQSQLVQEIESSPEFIALQAAIDAASDNGHFVIGLFQSLLGRSPGAAELVQFVSPLDAARDAVLPQVASSFVLGGEYRAKLVTDAFQKLLNRPASSADVAFWTGQLNAGMSREQFDAFLVGTDEYFHNPQKGNGDLATFVNAAFLDVLNRPARAADITFWTNALLSGLSRQGMSQSLFTSGEYRAGVITATFQTLLNRPAQPEDIAFWTNQLSSGVSTDSFITLIAGAHESLHANGDTGRGWLANLYQNLLGRTPAASELDASEGTLLSLYAGARQAAAAAIESGPEYRAKLVTDAFQKLLNRPASSADVAFWTGQLNAGMSREQFDAFLVGTDEYFHNPGKGNGNLATFINSVFQDVLNRPATSADVSFWTTVLQGGSMTRQGMAQFLFGGGEYRADLIDAAFETFTGGHAAANDTAFWQNYFGNGGNDDTLYLTLSQSDTYFRAPHTVP